MRLFPFDDPLHSEAAELLPWYANGTLTGSERAKVERHLAECLACRRELEGLRVLHAIYVQSDSEPVITQALARVQTRIEQSESGATATSLIRALVTHWQEARPWLRGAVITPLVLLAVLALAMLIEPTPRYYHTLGASVAPANQRTSVVVVFDGSRSEREIRDLLLRLHARIADGPSPDGAYTLEVAAADQQRLVAQLQQEVMVTVVGTKPRRPSDPR